MTDKPKNVTITEFNMQLVREMASIAPPPGENGEPPSEADQMKALALRGNLASMALCVAMTRIANVFEAQMQQANQPPLILPQDLRRGIH